MEPINLKKETTAYENKLIYKALQCSENVQQASERLSIKRTTLVQKMTRANIIWSFCACGACQKGNRYVMSKILNG